jgi:selenocysteine lyase/cysteine desulfurase
LQLQPRRRATGEPYEEEFPITRRYSYLNNAAVSPLPRRVISAVSKFDEERASEGDLAWGRWMEALEETRRLAAELIRASPDEIAFVKNTSEGVSAIANSLDWKPGDKVVTTDSEFPSNLYPWLNLRRRGVEVELVGHGRDGAISLEEIGRAARGARLVAISHVQYASGFMTDLRALRDAIGGDALLFVDAIQSLGAIRFDCRPADFVASGGHKWLLAPFGIGILYIRRGLELEPAEVGWMSAEDPEALSQELKLAGSARRFECGCHDYSAVYGLREALKLLSEVGMGAVERRVRSLADLAVERALEMGIELQTPVDPGKRAGIVNLKVDGPEALAHRLLGRGVVVAARMGGLRLSPHFYNREGDLERFFEALAGLR